MPEENTSNIFPAFRAVAETHPDEPALVFPDVTFTYVQLLDLASTFSFRFQEAGVDRQSVIAIRSDDLAVVIPSILASALLGARLAMWSDEDLPDQPCETSHEVVTAHRFSPCKLIEVDARFSPHLVTSEEKEALWRSEGSVDPVAPWLLFPQSSLNGDGSAIALSQALVMRRITEFAEALEAPKVRFASLWPTTSYSFAVRALAVLLHGGTIVDSALRKQFLGEKVTWLSAPLPKLRQFFAEVEDTGKIRKLEFAGYGLTDRTVAVLRSGFDELDEVIETAETGLLFVNKYRTEASGNLQRSGHALVADLRLESARPDLVSTGELFVRPNNPTAFVFAHDVTAPLPLTANGWFATGMVAEFSPDGPLRPIKPIDPFTLEIGGASMKASLVQDVIKSCSGILDVVVFASPKKHVDELLAFAVFEQDVNRLQISELAKHRCVSELGHVFAPAKIWPIEAIPLTSNYLPDRAACAEMILAAAKQSQNMTT